MKMAMMRRPRTGGLVIPFSPSRRRFVTGAAGGLGWLALGAPGRAAGGPTDQGSNPPELRGSRFDLDIGSLPVNFTGPAAHRDGHRRLAAGADAALARGGPGGDPGVQPARRGQLDPLARDDPPGGDGRGAGHQLPRHPARRNLRVPLRCRQGGTYWYHSHSGFQEQTGMYGAIVIEPAGGEAFPAEREHIIVLSDWSDQRPEAIYARLKKDPPLLQHESPHGGRPLPGHRAPRPFRRRPGPRDVERDADERPGHFRCHGIHLHLPDERPPPGGRRLLPVPRRRARAPADHQRRGDDLLRLPDSRTRPEGGGRRWAGHRAGHRRGDPAGSGGDLRRDRRAARRRRLPAVRAGD